MLLRALGMLILFTGAAAAQTGQAASERASRNTNRELRADRARAAVQRPAERAPRGLTRDTRTDRPRTVAQTPAERASRSLERDMQGDRFRDAAQDARGRDTPTRPEVQQFEPQRRSLQPDVGRPEQQGVMSPRGTPGTAGVGTQEQR